MSATLSRPMMSRVGPRVISNGAGAPPLVRGGLSALTQDAIFWYASVATFDGTGINTVTANIPIQSDAHFVCTMAMADNTLNFAAAAALPAIALFGGALVVLQDGAAQRNLNNVAIPVSELFGTGREPYVWPFTHIFRANGFIGVSATGSAAAMANQSVRFAFGGVKIPIGVRPDLGL